MSPKHHSSLSERMTPTTCPTTGPTCGWLETCTSDFGLRNTVKSHSLRVLIILAALVMLCHVYVMFNSLTLPNFIVVHIPIHHSTSTCFKGCTSNPGECWKCSSRIPKRPAARHSRIHCPGSAGPAGPAGSTVHERSSCPSSVKLSEDAWSQWGPRGTNGEPVNI
jgi:hypothetical protein